MRKTLKLLLILSISSLFLVACKSKLDEKNDLVEREVEDEVLIDKEEGVEKELPEDLGESKEEKLDGDYIRYTTNDKRMSFLYPKELKDIIIIQEDENFTGVHIMDNHTSPGYDFGGFVNSLIVYPQEEFQRLVDEGGPYLRPVEHNEKTNETLGIIGPTDVQFTDESQEDYFKIEESIPKIIESMEIKGWD